MPAPISRLRAILGTTLIGYALPFTLFGYTKTGTIYTTDGSMPDVQAAISHSSTGDTVSIPSGTFTWGTSGAFVSVNKAVTLEGAGQGSTVIKLSETGGVWTSATIRVTAAATIKSMTVIQPNNGPITAFSAIGADGWRFTDIEFVGGTSGGYMLYVGNAYGLVDNSVITGSAGNAELIFARGKSDAWITDSTMGTTQAVYIENCTFNGEGYVCDFNSYGKGVVRSCTITGNIKVDGHGKYTNTPPRGVRHMEVYNNTWTCDGGSFAAMDLRGGTGMVFNNRTTKAAGAWLLVQQYEVGGGATAANWPIDDQIGVGRDPKVGGSEPMYFWSNRRSGGLDVPWPIESYSDMTGIVTADRDYFNEVPLFGGSRGVGIGTKAQMSAIVPTKTGVGFWVTDEAEWDSTQPGFDGQLYVWNGLAWAVKYTPYRYPHPLRGEVTPTDSNTPPTDVKIQVVTDSL